MDSNEEYQVAIEKPRHGFKVYITNGGKNFVKLPKTIKSFEHNITLYKNKIIIFWNEGMMYTIWTDVYSILSHIESFISDDLLENFYKENKIQKNIPPLNSMEVISYNVDEKNFRKIIGKDYNFDDILTQLINTLP